ncbi:hypothetical protein MAR_018026, partial [Mya arenaria]
MDTVKRAENEGLVCTRTIVGVNSASNRKGLYMVSSCPKNNDTDCESEHVAAWGSLAPVYSPERERVYRNKHCAQCHYVEDAVDLKPSFICRAGMARKSITVEEVLLAIETRFEEQSFCSVSFTLPEEAMNVSRRSLQCFPEIERKCQPLEFSDPGEIDHMCRNGPLVPISYRVGSRYWWFGNAFCAYCNGIEFVEYCYHPSFEYTSMVNNQLAPMSSMDSFIMFLSNNEILTSEKLSDSQKYVRSVCATKTEHATCRPVFCPVLQQRQPDGTCGPSVVDVVGQDYEINLNFTLTPSMEIPLFKKLCEKVDKRNKRFPANFRSPWSRFWAVKNEVYYHIEKGMVVYFVTSLTRRNRGVALHKILENTANTMRTQWIIDGGEETNVGQDFSRYSTFRLGQSHTPGNLTFIPFALEDVSKPEETIFGGLLNNHQFSMW